MQMISIFAVDDSVLSSSQTALDVMISREEEVRAANAVHMLNDRQRDALLAKHYCHVDGVTVQSLATEWRVSRQRVYQIANDALMCVKRSVQSATSWENRE